MEIWEIERIIQNLQIKLDYLTERVENNHYQSYGTDVKYEYGERTRGTKTEIQAVKDQIAQYQEALERKKANKSKVEDKLKISTFDYEKKNREEELANKQENEQRRLEVFNQVKQAYKNSKGHSFRRIVDKLQGRAPEWNKVEKYTQEELEYILKTLQGKTELRKEVISKVKNKNLSFKETKKMIKNSNWDAFTKMLRSKAKLKTNIEVEQMRERNGMHL